MNQRYTKGRESGMITKKVPPIYKGIHGSTAEWQYYNIITANNNQNEGIEL